VVEHLPSKFKALNSNPSIKKRRKQCSPIHCSQKSGSNSNVHQHINNTYYLGMLLSLEKEDSGVCHNTDEHGKHYTK
jgi:hypothetical protein